jgi:3-oxoadipate enol-lactonase
MSAPAFTDVGLPTQPTVVFLHGVGGGRHGWASQQAHVAQMGWRSLAWDMPGYGDSAMVSPYEFAHLARALWQMLDAAHIDQAVFVGHSMGAMVALQAWTQKPERITGLLLAASSPAFGNTDGDFQKQFLAQRLAPLEAGKTMGDIADKLIPTMATPGGDPRQLDPHLFEVGAPKHVCCAARHLPRCLACAGAVRATHCLAHHHRAGVVPGR